MTSRINESPGSSFCGRSDSTSNDVSSCPKSEEEEVCPVIEDNGTICGETKTLGIFKEFRQIYDDCIRKMECNKEDNSALRKLAPFRKLVEDLWEQNAMLVETVEELEQEATSRVSQLQCKLDKCSEKDVERLIREKDREICCLSEELSGKDELLGKYYTQIDELRRDMTARSRKYQQILERLKDAAVLRLTKLPPDLDNVCDECNESEMDQRMSKCSKRAEASQCELRCLAIDKNGFACEKKDARQTVDPEDPRSESGDLRAAKCENDELRARLEQVKQERDQLLEKVNSLHQNIKELDNSFKETRWALTAEVAEKHDQIQELKRCLAALEEQMREADMKAHFKDDIIKEMRKELKQSRKMVCAGDGVAKVPVQVAPPAKPLGLQPWRYDVPVKESSDEDLKLDIRLFPIGENETRKALATKAHKYFSENLTSVEVQTEIKKCTSKCTRNVSTQHTTRVQKLPRSFGTLTVTPWSGASGEGPVCNVESQFSSETRKNVKGIYTVPCSSLS